MWKDATKFKSYKVICNHRKKLETQYIWIEAANTQCVETKAHFTETETRLFDRRGILCVVS